MPCWHFSLTAALGLKPRPYRACCAFATSTAHVSLSILKLFMDISMDASSIQVLIEQGLPGAAVTVSGADGVHFEATVVAAQFAGKLPLARHRLVYATLGERMGGAIHALALKTLTPDEAAARP